MIRTVLSDGEDRGSGLRTSVHVYICLSAQPKSRQILAASHTWSKGWSSRIQGDEIKELYRCELRSLWEECAFKKKRVAEKG